LQRARSRRKTDPRRGKREGSKRAAAQKKQSSKPTPKRRFGVLFYETLAAAKSDLSNIEIKARGVDKLNIVIKAEADMDDIELNSVAKVYAGAAWTIIHERRVYEGWYLDRH